MSNSRSIQRSICGDRRLLHFTMKITDRLAAKNFFCNILGMKILRHEEMDFGCSARCNGDFQSPWSKTMVGYGHENSFFAFELNYNYDVEGYTYGNDFSSVTICNRQAIVNARQFLDKKFIEQDDTQSMIIRSPDGHRFILINENIDPSNDPVQCLSLNVSNLKKSIDYYTHLLKMTINENESNEKYVKLYYGLTKNPESKVQTKSGFRLDKQCQLELIELDHHPINRGTGYGRKAFSCPTDDVELIQEMIEKAGHDILIPVMELGETENLNKDKIVILSDPDKHEICFVGEENYFKACETDRDAEKKFFNSLENKSNHPNKYLIGEDESIKQQ